MGAQKCSTQSVPSTCGAFFFLPLPAAAPSLCCRLGPVSQLESIVCPIFQFCSSESVKEEGADWSATPRLQGELKDKGEPDLHHHTLTLTLAVSGTTLFTFQKGCVC